jgi:hypothetical protein
MRNIGIAILVVLSTQAFSQASYKVGQGSEIVVKGTSTLHDWEMKSKSISGQAGFVIEGEELRELKDMTITLAAESLKSDKESMDKNAYKSLKTSSNKNISFQSIRVISVKKAVSGYDVTCEGKLQIAGAIKSTTVTANCQIEGTTVRCKGEKTFKMSEYQVEPPSFMFGSVKTGDEVTILINVVFNK